MYIPCGVKDKTVTTKDTNIEHNVITRFIKTENSNLVRICNFYVSPSIKRPSLARERRVKKP